MDLLISTSGKCFACKKDIARRTAISCPQQGRYRLWAQSNLTAVRKKPSCPLILRLEFEMNERNLFRTRQPDLVLARKLTWVVWVVSAAVLSLVALMREVKIPIPDYFDLSYLPAFHAILNTFAAFFLVAAIHAIGKGRVLRHRRMI